MGIIKDVAKGFLNAATAPLRMVWNGAKAVGNMLQIVGNKLTGDEANLKKNMEQLKDAGKGVAFAGIETAVAPIPFASTFVGTLEARNRR